MTRAEIGIDSFDEIEDCIRWYPPSFEPLSPEKVFDGQGINLYVHIPFCRGGCFFCPFNRVVYKDCQVADYLLALAEELKLLEKKIGLKQLRLSAVWIGGGTPSDLSLAHINELFTLLKRFFDFGSAEITFEGIADGQSFSRAKLKALRRHGVTNLSLGVQSLDDKFLRGVLRRRYAAADALQTIALAQEFDFTVNADYMYRLPGQETKELVVDINRLISTGLKHITCFPFMIIPNTNMQELIDEGRIPRRPDKHAYFTMYKSLLRAMHAAGFTEYTPYHFGKGVQFQYHHDRWGFPQKETLGVGAGAFSFFRNHVYTNVHKIDDYIARIKEGRPSVLVGTRVNDCERLARYAVLGCKLLTIDKDSFRKLTGHDFDSTFPWAVRTLVKKGLVRSTRRTLTLTALGKAFSNEVSKHFFTDPERGRRQPLGVDYRK